MPTQWSFARRSHCQRGHLLAGENIRPYADGRRECRLCKKWRQRHGAVDVRDKCPHGHRYTVASSYISPDGQRRCRVCRTRRASSATCAVSRCRRKQVEQGLCMTHAALCAVLDEWYAAYWRSAGYYGRI